MCLLIHLILIIGVSKGVNLLYVLIELILEEVIHHLYAQVTRVSKFEGLLGIEGCTVEDVYCVLFCH